MISLSYCKDKLKTVKNGQKMERAKQKYWKTRNQGQLHVEQWTEVWQNATAQARLSVG